MEDCVVSDDCFMEISSRGDFFTLLMCSSVCRNVRARLLETREAFRTEFIETCGLLRKKQTKNNGFGLRLMRFDGGEIPQEPIERLAAICIGLMEPLHLHETLFGLSWGKYVDKRMGDNGNDISEHPEFIRVVFYLRYPHDYDIWGPMLLRLIREGNLLILELAREMWDILIEDRNIHFIKEVLEGEPMLSQLFWDAFRHKIKFKNKISIYPSSLVVVKGMVDNGNQERMIRWFNRKEERFPLWNFLNRPDGIGTMRYLLRNKLLIANRALIDTLLWGGTESIPIARCSNLMVIAKYGIFIGEVSSMIATNGPSSLKDYEEIGEKKHR